MTGINEIQNIFKINTSISIGEFIGIFLSIILFIIGLIITNKQRNKDKLGYILDGGTLPTFIAIKDKQEYDCRFEHNEYNTHGRYYSTYVIYIEGEKKPIVSCDSKKLCKDKLEELGYKLKF